MTLEERLKPDSEVRINFFNEALEFHDLFGTTVLRVTLRNNTLSFNSFIKCFLKTLYLSSSNCCFLPKSGRCLLARRR
uniref:HisKA_2 domain-containing protein n=1 Tax=Globodera pallida TaxID=36090 RepID=A0A183BU60_GLOPA